MKFHFFLLIIFLLKLTAQNFENSFEKTDKLVEKFNDKNKITVLLFQFPIKINLSIQKDLEFQI